MIRYPKLGVEDLAFNREPIVYFDQAADPFASLPMNDEPIEPTPTVSDPTDWKYAAATNQPLPVESEIAWNSEPIEKPESPTIVLNKYEDPTTAVVPVDLYPVDYEVPKMKEPITCNCVDYPCDCDGTVIATQKIDLPLPYEPYPPIVDLPTATPPVNLPGDVPVRSYPPTVNINVATQTPTTQQAAGTGDASDGETPMIFGYPWYYAVGAAAAALFLMSSMDGKK